ncbi:MAG: hypothetical protein AAGA54_08890 [Myxococcota bacterium]
MVPARPRLRRSLVAFSLGALVSWGAPAQASAAGVRAAGSAKLSEWKKGATASKARTRAIRRARVAALQAALDDLSGPFDDEARRAVLKAGERWTGAYRIVSEHVDADGVRVELEVDIDVARLAKFVAPSALPTPATARYHVSAIEAGEDCGIEAAQLDEDLARVGVPRSPVGRSEGVTIQLACEALGPVPNTLLRAVRVRAEATLGRKTLVAPSVAAFGIDDDSARARGAAELADTLASALGRRDAAVEIRVEAPHPAARVRRLERAMVDSVRGVRAASVGGIDPDGAVRLRVKGNASPDAIARGLEALSLPDFSITIVGVDAHALTIRLR